MNNNRFIILYYLPGNELSLIEIKRQDLGEIKEPGKLYHWLRIDDQSSQIAKLEFRAMNSQPNEETREFVQGKLKFDQTAGIFEDFANGQAHTLQVEPVEQVLQAVVALVDRYLDSCT